VNLIEATKSNAQKADAERPIGETVARIVKLNAGLAQFWSSAQGWAPKGAADLVSKSRLDRQVSLSESLRHWTQGAEAEISDGDLILAWANLGSLIEGTIKLFLAVYYEDYKKDLETLKETQAWHAKQEKLLDPDGLRLDVLVAYCEKADLLGAKDLELCRLVQSRRNAIHAFRDREIGTGAELWLAIRSYLVFSRATNLRLPYPDDHYCPREI